MLLRIKLIPVKVLHTAAPFFVSKNLHSNLIFLPKNRFFKWKAIKNCKKLVKFLGKRKLLPSFAGYLLRVKKLFRVNC